MKNRDVTLGVPIRKEIAVENTEGTEPCILKRDENVSDPPRLHLVFLGKNKREIKRREGVWMGVL